MSTDSFQKRLYRKYYLGSIFFFFNVLTFGVSHLPFLNDSFFLLISLANDILINTYNEELSLIKKILRTIFITKPKSIIIICHNSTFFDTTRS